MARWQAHGRALAAGLVAAGLLAACPATSPRPAADARDLGQAFVTAAQAHRALNNGDMEGASRALAQVDQQLRQARTAAPLGSQQRVLALEAQALSARQALALGTPAGLAQAQAATASLLDAMLSLSPLNDPLLAPSRVTKTAAPPVQGGTAGEAVAPPPGGGAGGPPPAAWPPPSAPSAPSPPAPREALRAMDRGFVAIAEVQRRLSADQPSLALAPLARARAELTTAQRHGTAHERQLAAALIARIATVRQLAAARSPQALREGRRLAHAWVRAHDDFFAAVGADRPPPGGGAGPASADPTLVE